MLHLTTSNRDDVLLLMADRPPVNAMDLPFLQALNEILEAISNLSPQAVVIAGLPGCFSAGVDLKAVPEYGPDEQRQMVCAINEMALAAYALPCPVVAAVTGHAIAGGMILALCADYRIAAAKGRYGLTEVHVGVPYPAAALGVVQAELEPRTARILALGGKLIDATECARLGVFDEVVSGGEVLDRATYVARELGALPHDTYVQTKASLRSAALAAMHYAADHDPLMTRWLPREVLKEAAGSVRLSGAPNSPA